MIQKLSNKKTPVYEILDYIITPSSSEVNTEVLVDGKTVVEMTCMFRNRAYGNTRFFSSNDTNTDIPGWNQPGTWGLQFEDSGLNLSIKMLGADYSRLRDAVIVRTGITYNDLNNKKLRYNLTSAGILTIFNTDDTVFRSYDATKETDTSATSSTPIKLFHRFVSHEYINNGTYVYDVKIWKNDVLIRHYLPVKRLSDNVYGLYDNVNNTFHKNEVSGYSFSGASKSEKEYIYSLLPQYVNDIVLNGTHINRIYNKGEIYWGNEQAATNHLIHGTCSRTANANIVINGDTSQQTDVEVNVSNGEFWLDELPSSISRITSLKDCFVQFNGNNEGQQYLQTLDVFDLPSQNCTNWRGMFYECKNVTSIKLSCITSSCRDITALFMRCTSLETIDLSRCIIANISASFMYGTFASCDALKDVYITEESTLNTLTNKLTSQGYNYIPSNNGKCTIHYNGVDYKWTGSAWTPQN